MSTTPMEPQQSAGLSQVERVTNTFFAPTRTMSDIRRSASWWLPFVLLVITGFLVNFGMAQRIGIQGLVEKQLSLTPKMAENIDKLSPEKKQEVIDSGIKRVKRSPYTTPIIQFVFLALSALVILGVSNFIFEARLRYAQALAITSYGLLPLAINGLLTLLVLYTVEPDTFNIMNPVMTNPAALMDFGTANKLMYSMISGLDVFSIWACGLIGLGIAKNSKAKTLTAGVTVFALYFLIFKVGGGALMSLFM